MEMKEIGKTKSAGYEMGVRKTVNASVEDAWNFIISKDGLRIWLGEIDNGVFNLNKPFKTAHCIEGKITVFKPYSHMRLKWKQPDWSNTSILQIRTIQAKTGTTVSFHQEKLLDSAQRETMINHWNGVLKNLIMTLESEQ